jgi:tetratricopeptide (TPR) repeat protein
MFFRPLLFSTIVLSALFCAAQYNTMDPLAEGARFRATLSGTIRDTTNHPIDGARIDVLDLQSGREVATAYSFSTGQFQVSNLPQGEYEVVASAGIVESRTRLQLDTDRDIQVRLPVNTMPDAASSPTVSLSQMKVPGRARRLFQKAQDAFRKARLNDAFSLVQKALGIYPDYAQALTLRGILRMQQGDARSAEPDLEKAIQLDYGDEMSYSALACLLNNQGEYDRAAQTLDRGMSLNPKSWQAHMEMARALIGKKNFGGAMRSLDRADTFAPPNVAITHLFRAEALVGLKNYDGAAKQLQAYLEKSPNGPEAADARRELEQLKQVTEAAKR